MKFFKSLLTNLRFYILLSSAILAAIIYVWIVQTTPGTLQAVKLSRIYELVATAYLYFALLAGPLTKTFTKFPFRGEYLFARRAIGVSAFFFASIHTYLAFFKEFGGFEGLGYLDNQYLLGMAMGFISLVILFFMTITSIDYAVKKMGFTKWKLLQRFVYLAGMLIVAHLVLLGADFIDLSKPIPQVFFLALIFLLSLQMRGLDIYMSKRFKNWPHVGLSFMLLVILTTIGAVFVYAPKNDQAISPFSIHAQHIQLAKQAQQANSTQTPASLANVPGLKGDRNKRFTVSFLHDDSIRANTDTTLTFQVFDASSGNKVNFFNTIYDKTLHLVIVDSELKYFNHIHPTLTDNGFTITTQFPKDGTYHLYLDFQPFGAIEQQFAFTIPVGHQQNPVFSKNKPDTQLTKTFDQYEVTLDYTHPLKATDLSVGQQIMTFTIKDAKTKKPVTTLKPYLAAYGHLVMINQETFDYLHVHPTNIKPPAPNANGGPTVEFLPLGLYGPIKPGIYRIFAQFNPNGKLMVADYTIRIE